MLETLTDSRIGNTCNWHKNAKEKNLKLNSMLLRTSNISYNRITVITTLLEICYGTYKNNLFLRPYKNSQKYKIFL